MEVNEKAAETNRFEVSLSGENKCKSQNCEENRMLNLQVASFSMTEKNVHLVRDSSLERTHWTYLSPYKPFNLEVI